MSDSGVSDKVDFNAFGLGDSPNGPAPQLAEDEAQWDKAIAEAFGQPFDQDKVEDETEELEEDSSDPELESQGATTPGSEGEGGGEGNSPGATGEEMDFVALFTETYGVPPTKEYLAGLASLQQWYAGLNNEQLTAIDSYLSGQGRFTTEAPPEPTPDPKVIAAQELAEKYKDDPDLGPLYENMVRQEQELAQLRTTTVQSIAQQQQANIDQQLVYAKSKFMEDRNLTEQDYFALEGVVGQSKILRGFVDASNGNVAEGYYKALDYAYWQTPTFRQAAIDAEVAAKLEKERATHQPRKDKASSVTGTGGNGASRTQPPTKPTTDQGRWAAVAAGIAEAQREGLPDT